MSTSGTFFRKKIEYDERNFLKDIVKVIEKLKFYKSEMFTIKYKGEKYRNIKFNDIKFNEIDFDENRFEYMYFNIYDKRAFEFKIMDLEKEGVDRGEIAVIYINCLEEGLSERASESYESESTMCGIAYIEEMTYCPKLAFDLIYEYLKLNQNDSFSTEYEFFYTLDVMEKISKKSYDEDWYCKKLE